MPSSSSPSGSGDPDYDFRYNLYDTLVILGAKKEISELLKKSLDGRITEEDVSALRSYNYDLINEGLGRIKNLNSKKVRIKAPITE